MNNLLIRNPRQEDANNVLEYLKIVGGETDNLSFGKEGIQYTLDQEKAYLSSIKKENNSIMLIGLINDEIIAIGSLIGSKREKMKHSVELAISVKKTYWNKGVASALIKRLINVAKSYDHIIQITLHVLKDNESAIHLYHKLGFVQAGVFPNHIHVKNAYKDSLFMVLKL